MRKATICVVIAVTCLTALAVALVASADDWVLLGKRTVALSADRDEIWVGEGEGRFKALKLRVIDTGVEFDRAVIVFGNDQTIEAPIRDFIPAGGSTGVFDLPGGNRVIKKIIMHYTTRPGTLDRAEVELWGLRD
jgi:hypothetical protein